MTRVRIAMIAAVGAIALSGGAALASGGGSGGSGSGDMPSASALSYDPAAEYEKGVAALATGDYKTAQKSLARVIAVLPEDGDVWSQLGQAKAGAGDLRGARKAYEKALKYEPDDVVTRGRYGVTLAQLNETDKAQAELETLKQRAAACAKPCAPAAALDTAIAAITAALPGAPAPAPIPAPTPGPSAQRDLLFVDPAQGDASYGVALALVNERRYGEALEALGQARRAFGPHPDVLTYMGYTHRKMGEYATAETYYRQALSIDPDHRGALEYYGELKVEEGDIAGARMLLARLDRTCAFGCQQAEELRRWIDTGGEPH